MIRMSAVFTAIACIWVSGACAQGVAAETTRNRLQEFSNTTLRGDVKSEYRKFRRKADFFGAFYANVIEDLSGSYWNANGVAVAEDNARAACRFKSDHPDDCVLFARMLPKNYGYDPQDTTLSRSAIQEFREYKRLQVFERFGAFAINDNGAIGYSWAEASLDWAEDEALKRCAKSARKILRKTPDSLHPAVDLPSKQGCRLVHKSP